jgi:hypothetical protein
MGVDLKQLEAQVKAEEKEAKAAKGKKPDLVVRLPAKKKSAAAEMTEDMAAADVPAGTMLDFIKGAEKKAAKKGGKK